MTIKKRRSAGEQQDPPPVTIPLRMDVFDALTLAAERADALADHVRRRLSELSAAGTDDESVELHALSVVALSVCDYLETIAEHARELVYVPPRSV